MEKDKKSPDTSNMSIRKTSKEEQELPKGAKIIKKEDPKIEVEEIENGYLITKRTEVSYTVGNNRDWMCMCHKWYTKTDPLTINIKDKELADLFDDE